LQQQLSISVEEKKRERTVQPSRTFMTGRLGKKSGLVIIGVDENQLLRL